MSEIIGAYNKAPDYVQELVQHTLDIEGGYVFDPSDSGGETNFGITLEVAREYDDLFNHYDGWDGTMREMPVGFAEDVYTYQYWLKPNLHKILEVTGYNTFLAYELFDTGVNLGINGTLRFLQRSLNVLNNNGKRWGDLVVDGVCGSGTLGALEKAYQEGGESNMILLFKMIDSLQGSHYIELAERRSKDEKWIRGWFSHRIR